MQLVATGWQNLMEPILKDVFINEYLQIPSKISMIASMEKSKKQQETYLGVAGLSDFEEFNGVVQDNSAYESYTKVISHTEWASKLPIQKKLFDDDQTNTIKTLTKGFATSAKRTRENDFWGLLRHAFDFFSGSQSKISLKTVEAIAA